MPIDNPFDFSGQVVLLTGPTGTLGRPMAHAFADAGATLVLADVDEAANMALAAETNRPDANTLAIAMDVLDPASVQAASSGLCCILNWDELPSVILKFCTSANRIAVATSIST